MSVPYKAAVAIVGASGSGKTTLLNLLLGLYTDYTGRIAVGDADLRRLGAAGMRRLVASVPQEEYFFNATVAENIAFGDGDGADFERIVEAARRAGAHDFIMRLPQQYRTPLADCAGDLSAGQRQRLAIARALYRRPRLLILDEALAHLDRETERTVLENVLAPDRDYTVIAVTHRTHFLDRFDAVWELTPDGRLVPATPRPHVVESQGL